MTPGYPVRGETFGAGIFCEFRSMVVCSPKCWEGGEGTCENSNSILHASFFFLTVTKEEYEVEVVGQRTVYNVVQ